MIPAEGTSLQDILIGHTLKLISEEKQQELVRLYLDGITQVRQNQSVSGIKTIRQIFNDLKTYKTKFEPKFIKESGEFFVQDSSQAFASMSRAQYLQHAQDSLEREKMIADEYLS